MGRQHGAHRPRQNRPCTYRNHCQQRAQQYHHPWLAAGEEEREHEHHRPPSPAGREGEAMMPPRPFPTHFLPAGTAPLRPPPARGGDAFPISPVRDKGSACALSHYYHKRQWMERTAPRRPRPPPASGRGGWGGDTRAAPPQRPAVCQPAGLDASPGSRTAAPQRLAQGSAPSGAANARVLCKCSAPAAATAPVQSAGERRCGGGGRRQQLPAHAPAPHGAAREV